MPQAALKFTAHNDGGALVLPEEVHKLTRTYGGRGAATARLDAGRPFREMLALDIQNIRGLTGAQYNEGLLNLISYYRVNFPGLMAK